jgi:integrase
MSLRDEGDKAFERSRATAQVKLAALVEEARSKRDSIRLVEKLYRLKTGEELITIALADLPDEWLRIPRKRKPNARYAAQCRSTLTRFVTFIRERFPQIADLSCVTRQVALEFMESESNRGVTPKTWNDVLMLLRTACKHLLPIGSINPFSNMPTRDVETVFRHPFKPEELKLIIEAAQSNDFVRPLLITGICTAMRRGDCCLLKWADVDFARRFITVKTAKTGATVAIPIFPMLYDELARTARGDSEFVFPRQALMYKGNPVGITKRVRTVFAAAGFKDAKKDENGEEVEQDETVRGQIHAKRTGGLRQASVRDFHSFRVTWVTLALTAGVPLELVQKVTGHKTTDVVLKHYFQPGREEFRRLIQTNMPALLTCGQNAPAQTPKDQALAILAKATPKTWKRDCASLKALLEVL